MQTFIIYCIRQYTNLRTLFCSNQKARLDLKSKRASLPGFQIGAVSAWSGRLQGSHFRWGPQCTERLGFQIRPLNHPHIYAARAEGSPSALLLSLSLPLRGRRSAFVTLYGFVYGSVDKAVHALAVGFCVGLNDFLFPFSNSEIDSIISFWNPFVLWFLLCFGHRQIITPRSL